MPSDYFDSTGSYEVPLNFTAPTFDDQSSVSPIALGALLVYSLVFLLGVLGNGAVIWVLGFQMKITVNSIWFLNLSVADLLCCLPLPLLAVPMALDHRWELGDAACKVFPSLVILNMFASVLLLTVVSMDRCALVIKPVWCHNHRLVLTAQIVCCAVWTCALLLTVPTFITKRTHLDPLSGKLTCGNDYSVFGSDHQHKAEVSVATMRFLGGFLLPFAAICIAYGMLLGRVQRSRFLRSKKTLKLVLVIVGGFVVCWTPFHICGLILAVESNDSPLFRSVNKIDPLIIALAYVNCCLNPLIYVIMGQDFKSKVCKSLTVILRNVLSEETPLSTSKADSHTQGTCNTEDQSSSGGGGALALD